MVTVLAPELTEIVLKFLRRSMAIPFFTVERVVEYPCVPPNARIGILNFVANLT